MEYAQLVEDIRAGRTAPVYLLHGPQTFMVDAILQALRDAVGADKHGTFACETYHADEDGGTKIAAAAREVPLLVPRRLIIVRDAQALCSREDDLAVILAYLDKPSPTTILALVAPALDGRHRLARKVAEVGVVLAAQKVQARELGPFVRHHGRALGVDLSPEAVAAVVEACGDDLSAVHDALAKLSLYVDSGGVAAPEDVQAIVAPSRQHPVFELVDALGARDTARAFRLVHRILAEQGEAPLKMLGLLARHVRQLVDLKTGRLESPRLAALPSFVRGKLEAQAERFTMRDLVRAVDAIHRADVALKSSRREGERVVELLVLEITAPDAHRTAAARRPGAAR
jgi:DNA polymerase-3 subunit delta